MASKSNTMMIGHCGLKNTHEKNRPCGYNIMQMLHRTINPHLGDPSKACRKKKLNLTTN